MRKNSYTTVEHYFNLPVVIDGKEKEFTGRLVTFGYSFKFYIMVEGKELVFEKDESGSYRVISDNDLAPTNKDVIEKIIESLKSIENL